MAPISVGVLPTVVKPVDSNCPFSAGIASWPQDGADLSQLLRRADVRLRQAKLDGRNRVLARDP